MQDDRPAGNGDLRFMMRRHDVKVTADVKYSEGGIDYVPSRGSGRHRDLKLDVYEPVDATQRLRPALIMAFGGAFLRGSKGEEVFAGENPNTSVAEYCRRFAERGFVCFSIDYRLMQEQPDPGVTPTIDDDTPVNIDRANYVRGLLGLPPCTRQMMVDTVEAATDDMSKSIGFVRARSLVYGIDVGRIAIGGFSAGARIAMNSAFIERAPVRAVVSISGGPSPAALDAMLTASAGYPAALMFYGDDDLPSVHTSHVAVEKLLPKTGTPHQLVRIAGANHFYLRTAAIRRADGSTTDVELEMADFLWRQLALSEL